MNKGGQFKTVCNQQCDNVTKYQQRQDQLSVLGICNIQFVNWSDSAGLWNPWLFWRISKKLVKPTFVQITLSLLFWNLALWLSVIREIQNLTDIEKKTRYFVFHKIIWENKIPKRRCYNFENMLKKERSKTNLNDT